MSMLEKSLPLAIGLNLIFPGLGYLYMGKIFAGIFGGLIIIAIFLASDTSTLLITWLVLNVIMVIDMVILHNKRTKQIAEQNTKKCPQCAEVIQRDAKMCRFCHAQLLDQLSS